MQGVNDLPAEKLIKTSAIVQSAHSAGTLPLNRVLGGGTGIFRSLEVELEYIVPPRSEANV